LMYGSPLSSSLTLSLAGRATQKREKVLQSAAARGSIRNTGSVDWRGEKITGTPAARWQSLLPCGVA
jgi:hypothetical protein